MKKLTRIFLVGLTLALVAALMIPAVAQDEEVPGPGEGGPIIVSNFGADVGTLNPFNVPDGTSNAVVGRIYPGFLANDPDIGYFSPDAPGGIVEDWEVSEDGFTYTFTLGQDWFWSDGVQITSADIAYAWEIMLDDSVLKDNNVTNIVDLVESIETPDDFTVVVTFSSPDCNALDTIAPLPVVPSHVFRELFPNNADINEGDSYYFGNGDVELVTSNNWDLLNVRPGEQVTLIANQDYPDSYRGGVIPAGWIYLQVPDQTVGVERFLAGDLSELGVPQSRQAELQDLADAGEIQGYNYAGGNVRFLSFNVADPANPVDGLDEDGNPQDQGLHPIFGDVRVRQALNYAINFEDINQGVFFGFGVQGTTHSRFDSWAHNFDIEPYPFDLDTADSLLTEAGWVDTDGDGVRECNGCLYATEVDPEFEGSPMEFELLTNAGNVSQEALGTVLQDQWGEVGAVVDFQPIDFNVLVDTFVNQTFDAVMIFWGFGFPADPDGIGVVFNPENDAVGAGFNASSYYNPRVTELLAEARSLPGCDQSERAPLYQEVQQILHDESPWIWIGFSEILVVAQPDVDGWEPRPTTGHTRGWNEDSWIIPSN